MNDDERDRMVEPADTSNSPENGDKRAKFVRLAEKRTKNVLEKVRVLSNLSNHHVYAYSDADVEEIFEAIERELALARGKFEARNKSKPDFKLSRRDSS